MTIRKLPEIKAFERPKNLEFLPSADALSRFDAGLHAADDSSDNSISIYDVIGEDPWSGGGTTAKRIAAALRSIGKREVVVNINSPGGDLFEGIAIYNLLRAHEGRVVVRVMGIAASAASIIAMAGDEIQVARSGFLMIHNCWVVAIGNRHDMRDIADWLEPFDGAMVDIYVARSKLSEKEAAKMMDAESWINGKDAVEKGLADDFLPADLIKDDPEARAGAKDIIAVRRVDAILADKGIPRHERGRLIAGVKNGAPVAAESILPVADGNRELEAELHRLQLSTHRNQNVSES